MIPTSQCVLPHLLPKPRIPIYLKIQHRRSLYVQFLGKADILSSPSDVYSPFWIQYRNLPGTDITVPVMSIDNEVNGRSSGKSFGQFTSEESGPSLTDIKTSVKVCSRSVCGIPCIYVLFCRPFLRI